MTNSNAPKFLLAPPHLSEQAEQIAYRKVEGCGPTLIWCGGLKSDMEGSKAQYLENWARAGGRAFIRFDYYGHGQSSGDFKDGTISRWAQDVVTVMDKLAGDEVVLIGSSMGGWAVLLAMQARQARVKAMLLIAPAPDFTEKLIWASWDEEKRSKLLKDGIIYEPSGYEEPYEYSAALFADGRKNLMLDAPIIYAGPVHILQGLQDDVVPPDYPRAIMKQLTSDDVALTLVKAGDHSLSRPQDLILLGALLGSLLENTLPVWDGN